MLTPSSPSTHAASWLRSYRAGVRVVDPAASLGVSRKTLYGWLRRFTLEGVGGLHNRSSLPHTVRDRLPEDQLSLLVALAADLVRRRRLVGHCSASASTMCRALRRHQLHRRPTHLGTRCDTKPALPAP